MCINENKKKTFIWTGTIYLVSIISILRANYNYIDDMGRVMSGAKGWSFYSRFLTDFLSTFVHTSNYLSDISPLPQLIAVALMAAAGIVALHLLSDSEIPPLWGAVSLIPFALSPYFLQCYSYKYDAPYMALSVFVSVLPPLFYSKTKKGRIIFFISVVLSILAVCTTYQASSGIFPMLVVAIALRLWNRKEQISEILKFAAISVLGYFTALILFRLFIVVPVDFYASTNLFPISKIVPGIFGNLGTYFTVILKDFRMIWLIVIGIICILFICVNIVSSKRSKLAAAFVSLTALIIMAALSFGAYLALEKPLYDPRGMYGFGVFISFLCISIVNCTNRVVSFSRYLCLILGWLFIVFSFNYGNALSEQKDYTEYRINQVISSLNSIESFDDSVKIVEIVGSEGYCPSIRNRPSNYRMLTNLVPITFSEDRSWGYTQLIEFHDLNNLVQNPDISLLDKDLPVLSDTPLHLIKGDSSNILIILK